MSATRRPRTSIPAITAIMDEIGVRGTGKMCLVTRLCGSLVVAMGSDASRVADRDRAVDVLTARGYVVEVLDDVAVYGVTFHVTG